MSASAVLPPLHDSRRMLPCPLAANVRLLGFDLLVSPRGDLLTIFGALRRAEDASAYSIERTDGLERDALVHFSTMVEALRLHVEALMEGDEVPS